MTNSVLSGSKLDTLYSAVIKYNRIQDNDWRQDSFGCEKYHYTSLPVLFSILENDSLWASNSRFSNDDSEEKLLGSEWCKKTNYRGDNYILCLCDEGDQLSQWRGYCHNGGASIELAVSNKMVFSVLEADYETSKKGKHENRIVRAIPVIYTNEIGAQSFFNEFCMSSLSHCNEHDLVPLLKNRSFYEELESRVIFSNEDGSLSKCIRFRTNANGVKVPYIVIKAGDLGKDLSGCKLDTSEEGINDFISKRARREEVWIPQGRNQESVYNKVLAQVEQQSKDRSPGDARIRVFCEGHLPIRKIIAAPTYDRSHIAEAIKRFCNSKYWLRSVEVIASDIPYIPPSR
jgi:hypothetical protein